MPHNSDIAPYSDQDVRRVMDRLVHDADFVDAVGKFRLRAWYPLLRPLAAPRIRRLLAQHASRIHSIRDFQEAIEPALARILQKTTETFTVSGLDSLDPNQAYTFLSNHRDIAMDPAFVNWALFNGGFETVRIAIGDNLIQQAYVGDLMRLNKSFIVKRNVSGPREMLKTYSLLSNYIRMSIDEGHSVWMAHREGRAKDGIDRTDPAILKMLAMAGKTRDESFSDALTALHIVPVSISYEFDPCASFKARELAITEAEGSYTKRPGEDVKSIATGIMGWKGRVHLHFGHPIASIPDDPNRLAEHIDHQIIIGQRVFDTGRLAETMLRGEDPADDLLPDVVTRFQRLVNTTPSAYRHKLLEIYANPFRQFTLHQEREL